MNDESSTRETGSNKEKILYAIRSLPDDATIEQAIHALQVLKKIEIGIQQIEAGLFIEHEEFMRQLEGESDL